MPGRRGTRPLKQWRYVGVYGPDLMLCVGTVRIGPFRQEFWAIWDRDAGRLHERTRRRHSAVELAEGRVVVDDGDVPIALDLDEEAGIETVCPSGSAYAWTRKQGGVAAVGTVTVAGKERRVESRAVIDDTAGYHSRHTRWHWSAGVGVATDGRPVAWNLVEGVNDPASSSERTVWVARRRQRAAAERLRRGPQPGRRARVPSGGGPRAQRELRAAPQPLPPAVRHLHRPAAGSRRRRARARRGLRRHGVPRRVLVTRADLFPTLQPTSRKQVVGC